MLKRKFEKLLLEWKNTSQHKPLVVKGCRQCGKTWLVQKFAKENYAHVIYLNFFLHKEYAAFFADSLDVERIVFLMSAAMQEKIVPHETVFVFDEIQECPEARTALKFFYLDGRYDVIATGSLLGVSGYGRAPRSVPVGYETILDMYPLDFEEFLWAKGVQNDVLELLQNCLAEEKPVPLALHQMLWQLFLQYIVVGGMPEAVQNFIDNNNMQQVLQVQRDIIRSYRDDMVKYAERKDKVLITECYDSIPKQLSKENKKFQYAVIRKGGKAERYVGSLQWLTDAGVAVKCRNLHTTELPLDGNADDNVFKIYVQDSGLFTAMLEDGTQGDVLQGNLLTYKGAVCENFVADVFHKMGRKLYYFRKDSGLEIDFVIRYQGKCTLVEVKATQGNAKSLRTVLSQPEKYHVEQGIKLGNYNVGRQGNVLTLPLYMAFLLRQV